MTGYYDPTAILDPLDNDQVNEIINREDVSKLIDMLSFMRPSKTYGKGGAYDKFIETYITPVFGDPDAHGNYVLTINDSNGKHPSVAYMAHHDTVHRNEGMQTDLIHWKVDKETNEIEISVINKSDRKKIKKTFTPKTGPQAGVEQVYYVNDPDDKEYANCLGADCTTGVWLILEMIECGCPGVYVIHADEEIGCVGSGALVDEYNDLTSEEKSEHWISKVTKAISFDRKSTASIITHQSGVRTASDKFAKELASILDKHMGPRDYLPFEGDDGGSYTDSNEYRMLISECTNLSVGYYDQHSEYEKQDLRFLLDLRDALVEYASDINDPDILHCYRDMTKVESKYGNFYGGRGTYFDYDYGYGYGGYDYGYGGGSNGASYTKRPSLKGTDSFSTQVLEKAKDLSFEEMKKIETQLSEMHNNNGEKFEDVDLIAYMMKWFPYIMAELFVSSGFEYKGLTEVMKAQAVRSTYNIRMNELFDEREKKQAESAEMTPDEIPF